MDGYMLGNAVSVLIGLVIGYVFNRITKYIEDRSDEEAKSERVNDKERELMLQVSKLMARAQLVQMHDQFAMLDFIDDSQLVAFCDLSKSYLELCKLTGEKDSVIEKYYQDIIVKR